VKNLPDFESVYSSHYAKVFRLCKGYTGGDEALAEDLAQDAFIKVYTHLRTFKGASQIGTWVYRIAVNTCLLYLRKNAKQSTKSLSFDVSDDLADASTIKEQQLQALYSCIHKLKDDDKTIILLTLEKMPQKEIAAFTGITHEAIRVKIHRIKQQLIQCTQDGRI